MLEVKDISFSYDGSHPICNQVSFSIASGDRMALTAKSGVGKTTICNIVAGFLEPDEGEVLVDGALPLKRGLYPIQMINQHPELAINPAIRIRTMLKDVPPIKDEIFEGLGIRKTWLDRYAHELSGGELQRFNIARALACAPRYLVADEITTMLDVVSQARIWEFLQAWQQKHECGILFVTHDEALMNLLATGVYELKPLLQNSL